MQALWRGTHASLSPPNITMNLTSASRCSAAAGYREH